MSGQKNEAQRTRRQILKGGLTGAAALALATGALIIPAFTVLRPDGSYLAWMDPPIRVKRVAGKPTIALLTEKTQEIASAFEKAVSKYPDQWYHFFDYWERYGS